MSAVMVTVTLYSKPYCSLCRKVETTLRWAQRKHPFTLEIVDISQDRLLLQRYAYDVPVIAIEGVERFKHSLDERSFVAALRDAARL